MYPISDVGEWKRFSQVSAFANFYPEKLPLNAFGRERCIWGPFLTFGSDGEVASGQKCSDDKGLEIIKLQRGIFQRSMLHGQKPRVAGYWWAAFKFRRCHGGFCLKFAFEIMDWACVFRVITTLNMTCGYFGKSADGVGAR